MSTFLTRLAFIVLMFSACGCQATPGSVGVSNIPVFPGARLESQDSMGALMGDATSRLESYTSTFWRFNTSAPAEEVVEYYRGQLPDAELDETDPGEFEDLDPEEIADDGIPRYSFYCVIGNSRNSDEEYSVEIGDGWFTISETLKD